MDDYTLQDYLIYLYAEGSLRIHRIIEAMDLLDLPDAGDYLLNALEQVQACLHFAAFQDRDAIQATTRIPGRVCMLQTGELKYSDGRAVTTTEIWDDGWATYVWHPDPAHPKNQPGRIIVVDDVRGPCNRKLIVTAPGFIDTIASTES